ncbi:helix-turn-helix domain-containing protein [Lutibacter sp. B2]|nr:helix-turn-helix domain-containing protein [Lutibacter sp. B2]
MAVAQRLEQLELEIDDSKQHIKRIHSKNKGWITVAQKNPDYKQRHYTYVKLEGKEEEILSTVNAYISQNTFYKPQRRIENIKELRALYIDIDCYNTKYSKDAVLYFLENDYFNSKIPIPNLVIDSGRGLYLIWLIEPVPSHALSLWYACQRFFYNELKKFGADAKALDPTRILRVVGTINSKTNTSVQIVDTYKHEYTLRDIQEEFLPEVKSKIKKKGRPKNIVKLFNEYSLYHARLLDLTKICELRDYKVDGSREFILFLYRYWTCCFTEDAVEALDKAIELNAMFVPPLKKDEVVKATKSAETCFDSKDKEYKYKNDTLIELLEITEEEQRQLKSIIGTREKYHRNNGRRKTERRNSNGLTKREQEKLDKENQIKKLIEQGLNKSKIAEELGINRSTMYRIYGSLLKGN